MESVGGMRRYFPFYGRSLSIAPHRSVDLAGPGFDAAVEVEGIVKAGVSEKVDDHLTASAVMAKDHQGMIGRQVVDTRWDLRHRNMQGAFQLADVKLSRLSDIENHMLPSRAPHIRKFLNRDCI
jgi:hypothetical protein